MTAMNKINYEEKFTFMVVVKENEMGVMLPDKEGTYRLFRLSWSEKTDYGWNRLEVTDPEGSKHDSWSEDHEEYKGWVTILYKGMKYVFEVTPFWDDPEEQTYTDECEVLIRVYEMGESDAPEESVEVSENAAYNRWAYECVNGSPEDEPRAVLYKDEHGDEYLHFKSVRSWSEKKKTYVPGTAVFCGESRGWRDGKLYTVTQIKIRDFLIDPLNSKEVNVPVREQRNDRASYVHIFADDGRTGGYSFIFWNGYILVWERMEGPSVAAYLTAAKRLRRLLGEDANPNDEWGRFLPLQGLPKDDYLAAQKKYWGDDPLEEVLLPGKNREKILEFRERIREYFPLAEVSRRGGRPRKGLPDKLYFTLVHAWDRRVKSFIACCNIVCTQYEGWFGGVKYPASQIRVEDLLTDPVGCEQANIPEDEQDPRELVYVFQDGEPGGPSLIFWGGGYVLRRESDKRLSREAFVVAANRIAYLLGSDVSPVEPLPSWGVDEG